MSITLRSPVLFALALAACNNGGDAGAASGGNDTIPPPPYTEATLPQDSGPTAGVPGNPTAGQRPAHKQGAIMTEGTADTMELRLVQAPDDFPLQFSTYVPPDMEVDTDVSSDGGRSIKVLANFAGRRNERAYVQFHFYPPGTTRALARNAITGFLSGLNPEIDLSQPAAPPPWGIERTRFVYPHEGQRFVGSVVLAERGDLLFHAVVHYPGEYGDGMAGRIAKIMEEWRWADGQPLDP